MAPWILQPHYIRDRCWNNFEWMKSSLHLWALKMGVAALSSLDLFQDISPLPGNDDDDTRGISDTVNVPVEVKGNFCRSFCRWRWRQQWVLRTPGGRRWCWVLLKCFWRYYWWWRIDWLTFRMSNPVFIFFSCSC